MNRNSITPQEGIHNQLITGTLVKGNINTEGDIKIDGRLIGKLETKGRVVIGETGSVEGEIVCINAQISGNIEGKIICEELLSLKASAKFTGDIITSKLSIEPGAQYSGYCQMPNGTSEEKSENEISAQDNQ